MKLLEVSAISDPAKAGVTLTRPKMLTCRPAAPQKLRLRPQPEELGGGGGRPDNSRHTRESSRNALGPSPWKPT